MRCPVSAHWACLSRQQQSDILSAVRDADEAAVRARRAAKGLPTEDIHLQKRAGLDAYQTTEFVCGSCTKGGICMRYGAHVCTFHRILLIPCITLVAYKRQFYPMALCQGHPIPRRKRLT
jgi:hypothetical protein